MTRPVFPKGYVITEYTSLAITIEGQASGGQGAVVWGPNAIRGRWEALKMVRPDRASPAARAAFEQEAIVWLHLWDHPCVIRANGIFIIPGLDLLPVLNLEYAPNGNLRDQLQQAHQPGAHIPLEAAFAWAQMIAAGLEHIHTPDPAHERDEPLVHCDLKPENVLLDKDNWTMLTDLGLAKAYAKGGVIPVASSGSGDATDLTIALDAAQLTRSTRVTPTAAMPEVGTRGAVQGTLPYMPPEQWRGVEAVVPASDIYAFGVLLFELFAGVSLYPHAPQHNSMQGWYAAHWQGPTRHLRDAEVHALDHGPLSDRTSAAGEADAAHIADQVDALIVACLAHAPQDRPTAAQVRQRFGEMATQLGFAPQVIPEVALHTPKNEAAFWNNLALTYGNVGHPAEELRLLKKARDLDPDDPNSWYMLGKPCRQSQQYEEALAVYKEAEQRLTPAWLHQYPGMDAAIWYGRGLLYSAIQRYPEAVSAYQQAVRINPNRGDSLVNLAINLVQLADQTAGVEHLRYLREAHDAITHAARLMPDDQRTQKISHQIKSMLQAAEHKQGGSV